MTRTWAQIVKGQDPSDDESTVDATQSFDASDESQLRPAARGERRCLCTGEILVMLGHYGWIMASEEIDHPDVAKTGGRIYVHSRDVEKGTRLMKGDQVSFFLYVDDQGLGAECCKLEERLPSSFNASANEFIPNANATDFVPNAGAAEFIPNASATEFIPNASASEFIPASESTKQYFTTQAGESYLDYSSRAWNLGAKEFVPSSPASCFNSQASEFVPLNAGVMNAGAKEFVPVTACSKPPPSDPNVVAINLAFFSDDESEDESSNDGSLSGDESDGGYNADNERSGRRLCQPKPYEQDSDSDDNPYECDSDVDVVVIDAPLKSPRLDMLDDSTSAGATSESEAEATREFLPVGPPGLSLKGCVRPPPGLSLPPGLSPPPGLCVAAM